MKIINPRATRKAISFRVTDKHKRLLKASAVANNVSITRVLEDALETYYNQK